MGNFVEAINNPIQEASETWHRSIDILENDPSRHVVRVGEDRFLTTVGVRPSEINGLHRLGLHMHNQDAYDQNYAIASKLSNRGRKLKLENPLYLIVNGNYVNPFIRINPNMHSLLIADDSFAEIEDTDTYLPNILKTLESIANVRAERHKKRVEDRKGTMAAAGGIAVGVILGIGAATGVIVEARHMWHGHQARFHRHNHEVAAARQVFDAKNINIAGLTLEANSVGFVPSQPGFFEQDIPSPTSSDTYSHPREISLFATDSCVFVATIDPQKENIRLITNEDDQRVIASVDTHGKVTACDADSTTEDSKLAAQIVNKQAG